MTTIASVMICATPKKRLGRSIISASESVWECVSEIPHDLTTLLTDDIGNSRPEYADRLQLTDLRAVDLIAEMGLHLCFRGVEKGLLPLIDVVPNSKIYESIQRNLVIVGWDVCCGNGWLPASLIGDYPIDVISGKGFGDEGQQTNEFGLFASKDAALENSVVNDDLVPEHAPFYPVAVMLTKSSVHTIGTFEKSKIRT